MTPTMVTSVYFENENVFSDFLVSSELTAKEIRSTLVSRLKKGEGLVAVINGSAPRGLVLRSTMELNLKGKIEGDELTSIPFA